MANGSAVSIFGFGHHNHILAENLVSEGFLGGLAKRLLDLRGIDGVEPDLELSSGFIETGQGIAVMHSHDSEMEQFFGAFLGRWPGKSGRDSCLGVSGPGSHENEQEETQDDGVTVYGFLPPYPGIVLCLISIRHDLAIVAIRECGYSSPSTVSLPQPAHIQRNFANG